MNEYIDFGDNVRVLRTPETESKGIAELVGNVFGVTTPSVTGIIPLGHAGEDRAINVHFDSLDRALWVAPHLVAFVDHGPGSVATIDGLSQRWTRTASGEWVEEPGSTLHRSLFERFAALLKR